MNLFGHGEEGSKPLVAFPSELFFAKITHTHKPKLKEPKNPERESKKKNLKKSDDREKST